MIVIIEGADCSGKTTLAAALAAHWKITPRHVGPPKDVAPFRQYMNACRDAVLSAEYTATSMALFDRLHIGERIYGPIVRSIDGLGPNLHFVLEELLTRYFNAVVIACRPPIDVILREWRPRALAGKELLTKPSEILAVIEQYDAFFKSSQLPVIHYNYTRHTTNDVLRALEDYPK